MPAEMIQNRCMIQKRHVIDNTDLNQRIQQSVSKFNDGNSSRNRNNCDGS